MINQTTVQLTIDTSKLEEILFLTRKIVIDSIKSGLGIDECMTTVTQTLDSTPELLRQMQSQVELIYKATERTIKAITLWQPWATLVAIGAKKYETRSWSTSYRGPLVIHAAKRFDDSEARLCFNEPFRTCLQQAGYRKVSDLLFGVAIAVVDLVDILPVEQVVGELSEQELAFGNYQPGRFAWQLENPIAFLWSIPMRGRQGLWTLTPYEIALIPNPKILL